MNKMDKVYKDVVERQAQLEPDWLNKPELISEMDRYAGEQPSRRGKSR